MGFVAAMHLFAAAYLSAGEGPVQARGQQAAAHSDPTGRAPAMRNSDPLESRNARSPMPLSVAANEDYRISPNDVIDVRVDKAEELSATYPINANGTFEMHFLGTIQAKGKTTEQLARFIADGLRGRYLVDPVVKVSILQFSGRSYFVLGAVHNPGLIQVGGYPTLLELITIAGGPTENHGSSAFVIRKVKQAVPVREGAGAETDETPAAQYDLVKVSINGLLKGMFENNIPVEPGDIINIPQTDLFFISGEVIAPGSYPLKEGTTLRQAVSIAQGLTFKAAGSRAVLFREKPSTGQREERAIDIPAILRGKQEDFVLLANDIIVVPTSKMKSVGSVLLTAFGYSSTRYVPAPIRH